jgi:intraflagellar transport protein 56
MSPVSELTLRTAGVCAAMVAGKEDHEALRDVVSMLRNTSNPQVEYIIRIMAKWGKENGVSVDR